MTKSPKLPALNVLDLSFFCLTIKIVEQQICQSNDGLIETVLMLAFDEFERTTLNFGWLALIGCYDNMITTYGDNKYEELRHMGKDKALRNGMLPEVHVPSDDALELFDMVVGA